MTQACAETRGAGLSNNIFANVAYDFSSFSTVIEFLLLLFKEPIEFGLVPYEHVVVVEFDDTYWKSGLYKFVPLLIDRGGLPDYGFYN